MVIVVVSGFLGRYLYTQVPELSSGVELEELDHERAFQKAAAALPVPMAEIDRELAVQRAQAQRGRDVAERARARCSGCSTQDLGSGSRHARDAAAGSSSSASTAARARISRAARRA